MTKKFWKQPLFWQLIAIFLLVFAPLALVLYFPAYTIMIVTMTVGSFLIGFQTVLILKEKPKKSV